MLRIPFPLVFNVHEPTCRMASRAVGRPQAGLSKRGVPFGLLGHFQHHEVMRLGNVVQGESNQTCLNCQAAANIRGKCPNKLWLLLAQ